jgi:hypothetical protein
MDALRHQLMMSTDRSDRLEAELAVLRGVVDASTELTGRPAPLRSDAAAPNATDIST